VQKNIGTVDKVIRLILGIVLLSLYFLLDSGLKYISILGIILILTAFINYCPLYTLFGINTCSTKKENISCR